MRAVDIAPVEGHYADVIRLAEQAAPSEARPREGRAGEPPKVDGSA